MAIRSLSIILILSISILSCFGGDRNIGIAKRDSSDTYDVGEDAGEFNQPGLDAQRFPDQGVLGETIIEASSQCGNGVVDENEQCDGIDSIRGMSCEALGYFAGGDLACDLITCTYDTRRCSLGPVCGNGILEQNEQCEVGLFNEMKCSEFNQDYDDYDGYVVCDPTTCNFDLSRCNVKSVCGNSILEGSEQCDGDQLNDMTCTNLDYGFSGGTLRCDPDTCSFDISDCEYSSNCGNGVIDPGEQCDGSSFGWVNCSTLGFYSGTLACSSDCRYDTSSCVNTTDGSGCFRGGDPRTCVITPPSDN